MIKVYISLSLLLVFLVFACGVKKPPLPPIEQDAQKVERSTIND
jgi:hypothetical protein